MKIRKFNESLDDSLIEYIEECFVELLDDGAYLKNEESYLEIVIICDKNDNNIVPKNSAIMSEEKFMIMYNEINSLSKKMSDVVEAVERLRIKYNESSLIVRTNFNYINNKCFFTVFLIPKKTT